MARLKNGSWHFLSFVAVFAASLSIATPAYAYIEPVTGSILVQMILGGTVGVIAIIKLYWHKLKNLFSSSKPKDNKADK